VLQHGNPASPHVVASKNGGPVSQLVLQSTFALQMELHCCAWADDVPASKNAIASALAHARVLALNFIDVHPFFL